MDASPTVHTINNIDISTPGNYLVTYSATDSAGNTATTTRTVVILDATAPVLSLNGSATIEIDENSTYVELGATAEDNLDQNVNVIVSGNVTTNEIGSYTLTYTATDTAGNSASINRTVNVLDATAPIITLNGNAFIQVDLDGNYVELGATATDNVDTDFSIIIESNLDTASYGSYVVVYTVLDAAGNRASINRIVNVTGEFITTWKTDNQGVSDDNQITITTATQNQNYMVNWGDGTLDANVSGTKTHTYASPGTYTINISGDFQNIKNGFNTDAKKLLSIDKWGDGQWSTMYQAFYSCENLTSNATDIPNLSAVTSMNQMFSGATAFNGDLSQWDVSNVQFMKEMFKEATVFTSDLSQWDVSSVSNTISMFDNARAFNSDLSSWNTPSLEDMYYMFSNARSFNSDLNSWNVSSVTDMHGVFYYATKFEGNISQWNVSRVRDMNDMFHGANSFNGNLSQWITSSAVVIGGMFRNATSFNSDLRLWDVTSVQSMLSMFSGATSFDRDLSLWDISSVFSMNNMFWGVTLSTENYDALLDGWSRKSLVSGVQFHGGNSQYSSTSQTARNNIINSYNWTIEDGGVAL